MCVKNGGTMTVIIERSIVEKTEGAKKAHLRSQLDQMIETALNSNHYSTKLPCFLLLTFLKFTPAYKRLQYDERLNEWQLKNHTLCFYTRATMPYPMWGTTLYIVRSGEKKHEMVWTLPNLAKNSPTFTYERAIRSHRPKAEINSIKRMIMGDLEKQTIEYNSNPLIVRSVQDLFDRGEIPLVSWDAKRSQYVPYAPSSV